MGRHNPIAARRNELRSARLQLAHDEPRLYEWHWAAAFVLMLQLRKGRHAGLENSIGNSAQTVQALPFVLHFAAWLGCAYFRSLLLPILSWHPQQQSVELRWPLRPARSHRTRGYRIAWLPCKHAMSFPCATQREHLGPAQFRAALSTKRQHFYMTCTRHHSRAHNIKNAGGTASPSSPSSVGHSQTIFPHPQATLESAARTLTTSRRGQATDYGPAAASAARPLRDTNIVSAA